MSEPKENSGRHGLEKDARLAEKREKRAEERKAEPLDPPFPYRVVAFDHIQLGRRLGIPVPQLDKPISTGQ